MGRVISFLVFILLLMAQVGCDPASPSNHASQSGKGKDAPVNRAESAKGGNGDLYGGRHSHIDSTEVKSWHFEILGIARSYQYFTLVSPQASWAPTMCRAAPPVPATYSASTDGSTHGDKLYYLYVKDFNHYVGLTDAEMLAVEPPVGQTIVKESWQPVAVDGAHSQAILDKNDTVAKMSWDFRKGEHPPAAERDGAYYQPGKKGPLFVMQFLGRGAPNTDRGWIYATLTPDGKEITAIGRIDSCMECHRTAPHGRLFGLTPSLRGTDFEP